VFNSLAQLPRKAPILPVAVLFLLTLTGKISVQLDSFAVQCDYRFPVWRLLSGVVFASAGDVASRVPSFNLPDLKFVAGAGLRYTFQKQKRLVLRIDFGVAKGSAG
jgi:hypothetical protein